MEGETENEEQYYDYAATGHDKRFFDDNNEGDNDGSVTGKGKDNKQKKIKFKIGNIN